MQNICGISKDMADHFESHKTEGIFFITNLCLNQLNAGILGKTKMKEYDILL